jgi:hypothetical protein
MFSSLGVWERIGIGAEGEGRLGNGGMETGGAMDLSGYIDYK